MRSSPIQPWKKLGAAIILVTATFSVQAANSIDVDIETAEQLLREWTPEPQGPPANDPWALPLIDGCPRLCDEAGPNAVNWTRLYSPNQLSFCDKPVIFGFNIYNPSISESVLRACAVHPDAPSSVKNVRAAESVPQCSESAPAITNATAFASSDRVPADHVHNTTQAAHILASQLGASVSCSDTILFAKAGSAVVGMWVGMKIDQHAASQLLDKNIPLSLGAGSRSLEICSQQHEAVLGIFTATDIPGIASIRESIKTWSAGSCLDQDRKAIGEQVFMDDLGSNTPRNRTTTHSPASIATTSHAPSLVMRANAKRSPVARPDGSCYDVTIHDGDNCWDIAAANSMTVKDIEDLNKKSWGWAGCGHLERTQKICLSAGNPAMPAPVDGVACGPQKPGTSPPGGSFTGEDLAKMNPCPLNACCSAWGFCGTTADFCTESRADTGAPGSHKPGMASCISNCNTDMVLSGPPEKFRKIGYFEGYGVSRGCGNVDIRGVGNINDFTHIHFAFATVKPDIYEVDMGPTINQFYYFKNIKTTAKKIVSFGGWSFSTDPATYGIFRTGVTPEHRGTMAKSIADFVLSNDLDGVDIDWEYPAAPDLPGIPAGNADEGINYLKFMITLRSLLRPHGKSISFAAPASFWYLKGFPIKAISSVVDYIVYMTYDLHGQWDYDNKWSMEGCTGGNCLRSHVNLTETMSALVMITKAGVPSNKVVVGVTSYGRSFKMTTPGCTGPMCNFVGPESGAAKGACTGAAGYLSQSEIKDIIATDPTAKVINDNSDSQILVYGGTEWVGFMDEATKSARSDRYRRLNFGGTSDWAISLDYSVMSPDSPNWGNEMRVRKLSSGKTLPDNSARVFYDIETCGKKGTEEYDMAKKAWDDAARLSDATQLWSRYNKYQGVLDRYLGKLSFEPARSDEAGQNFRRHWEMHYGSEGGKGPGMKHVSVYIYCSSKSKLLNLHEKPQNQNEDRCKSIKSDGYSRAKVYRRYGGGDHRPSQYHVLLCPAFFGHDGRSPGGDLDSRIRMAGNDLTYRQNIRFWAQNGIRGVTMYHEMSHMEDVNYPRCTGFNEIYAIKDILKLARGKDWGNYELNVANAQTWVRFSFHAN